MLIIVAASLLLPIMASAAGEVEYRAGEKAAENLFNKGIGKAWTGGDPFGSGQWGVGESSQTYAVRPFSNYQILGYLSAVNGFIIASDGGKSLQITPGPGSYPIYGYFDGNKLMGIFIDLSSSGNAIQLNPKL
ncbi:Uncharacterised protein [uncultured archaeon]|nr:Uncharacterised protein [uncultured archaeon]